MVNKEVIELIKNNKFQEVIDMLDKIENKTASDYMYLSHAHNSLNDNVKGKAYLKNVLELDPNHTLALNNLSMMESMSGNFTEAIALLDRAIELNKGNIITHINKVELLQYLKKFDEVISYCDYIDNLTELSKFSKAPLVIHKMRAYIEMKEPNEVIKLWNKYKDNIMYNDNYKEGYSCLASTTFEAYIILGNIQEAINLVKYDNHLSNDLTLRLQLVNLLIDVKRFDEAEIEINYVLKNFENLPNELQEAISVFKDVINENRHEHADITRPKFLS